jgi:hypothetical protein
MELRGCAHPLSEYTPKLADVDTVPLEEWVGVRVAVGMGWVVCSGFGVAVGVGDNAGTRSVAGVGEYWVRKRRIRTNERTSPMPEIIFQVTAGFILPYCSNRAFSF